MLVTRKVIFGIWSAAFALIIGCQGESDYAEVPSDTSDTYSETASPTEIEPTNDPVAEFRDYALVVIALAKGVVKDKRFQVTASNYTATARFEISDDYTIDVKKSDSLISPFVGIVKLKGRNVYDEVFGIKDFTDKWVEVEIECGYKNGSWSTSTDLSESLLPR